MPPFKLLSLFLLTVLAPVSYATTTCNVLDYGGVADNATDIGPAITKAYADCVSGATTNNPVDTVLLVPPGTYAIETPVSFHKANYFTIEIDGELNLVFNPALGGNIFLFDRSDYGRDVWLRGVCVESADNVHVCCSCLDGQRYDSWTR